jgi:hypothetical protein
MQRRPTRLNGFYFGTGSTEIAPNPAVGGDRPRALLAGENQRRETPSVASILILRSSFVRKGGD